MGKATIVAHLGGALYSVVIEQDESRLGDMIQAAQDMLDLLAPELDAAQTEYDAAIADYTQTLAERDDDIDLALPGVPIPESLAQAINEKTAEASAWFDIVARAETRLNNIKARILNLELRIVWLQGLYGADPLPSTAYCIDMCDGETEDGGDPRPLLTGTVATVEPFRRCDEIRLINGGTPQYRADPTYVAATDGVIVPVSSMTPAQYLYNYAMWSGAEAWRGRFHVAQIVSKSTPSGPVDVELQFGNHLAQDGFTTTLTDVPVQYMDCDGKAFMAGDYVIVTYSTGNTSPKVIGFAQAPRPCPLPKDFLIHATTEATYWRLTFDPDTNTWSKSAAGKVAGPHIWYGRNRVVSCEFHAKLIYMNATSYSTAAINTTGMKPMHACYNSRGNLAGFFVPVSATSGVRYSQVWERISGVWTFVANIEAVSVTSGNYAGDKEWGWFRFRIWSPDGDKLLDPESGQVHTIDWESPAATVTQGVQIVADRAGALPTRYSSTTAYTAKTHTATYSQKNATYQTDKSSFTAVDGYFWSPASAVITVGGQYSYNLSGGEDWECYYIPYNCPSNANQEAVQNLDYYEDSQVSGSLDLGGYLLPGMHDYHLERQRSGYLRKYTDETCSATQVDPFPEQSYTQDWTSFLYAGAFIKAFPYANAYLCISQDMKDYHDEYLGGAGLNLECPVGQFPWSLNGLGIDDDDRRWRLYRSRYSSADKTTKYAIVYDSGIADSGGALPSAVVESDANYGVNLFDDSGRNNEWVAKHTGGSTEGTVDNALYLEVDGDWQGVLTVSNNVNDLTVMDEAHSQFLSVQHTNPYGEYQGSPSAYCEIAADLYGNVCAINNQQNKDGSRIRYLSHGGDLDTLFAGFDLDGLRLVGMI